MKKILDLFITFFKIGLFTFGGGYAMISIIENECVNKKNWISKEDMNELIVLAESTPGPIAINSSTFVGYKVNMLSYMPIFNNWNVKLKTQYHYISTTKLNKTHRYKTNKI